MGYKVINAFVDHNDNDRVYEENDVFPHKDSKTKLTKEWLEVLSTNKNDSKVPFIIDDATKEPEEDKPLSKYTKDELKLYLSKQGIAFEEDAKKDDLLALAKVDEE